MNKWGIQLRGRNYIKVSNGNVRNKFFFFKNSNRDEENL